jgi:hypothetical protein
MTGPNTATLNTSARGRELTTVLIFQDGYDHWGWWCPKCSRPRLLISQDGYVSSAKARRSAHKHEIRRGH